MRAATYMCTSCVAYHASFGASKTLILYQRLESVKGARSVVGEVLNKLIAVPFFLMIATVLFPSVLFGGSTFMEWQSGTTGSGGGINVVVDTAIVKGSLTTFSNVNTGTNPVFVDLFSSSFEGMSHQSGPGSTPSDIMTTVNFSSALPVGARLLVIDLDVAGESMTLFSGGNPLTLVTQLETRSGQSSDFPSWDSGTGVLTATTASGQFNNTEASVFDVTGLTTIQVDSSGGKNNSGVGVAIALPSGAINTTFIEDELPLVGNSVLQVDIGGLSSDPNALEHDLYSVTGSPASATLAGRLDIPLFDLGGGVFDPDPNDQISFLSAASISGKFDALSSPNLGVVDPGLATVVVQSATNVGVRFVPTESGNQFAGTATNSNWASGSNWTAAVPPGSANVVTVDNSGLVDQRVEVDADPNLADSENAFVHSLVVEGTTNKMTLSVQSGSNLSAVAGLEVSQNGIAELGGGTLVTSELRIEGGGEVLGNGTVVGNLLVGDGGGTMATLSPGIASSGKIDIQGNYQQQSNGAILLEIDDPNTFDTIAITGSANLDGALEVMLADPNAAPVGTVFEVMTTNGITGTFQNVSTVGADDIVLVPTYGISPLVSLPQVGALAFGDSVYLTSFAEGDMDPFTPGLGEEDAVAFALALTDPVAYRNTYGISADEMGDIDDLNGLDFDDIDDFVQLLNEATGGSMSMAQMFRIIEEVQAVPEPNALALVLAAGGLVLGRLRYMPR